MINSILTGRGNTRKTRDITNRTYAARKSSFKNSKGPYTENDISSESVEGVLYDQWAPYSWWFHSGIIFVAYAIFPSILNLVGVVSDSAESVVFLTQSVLPGVGILFGSLISMTYSILVSRQSSLQDVTTKEASTLATIAHEIDIVFEKGSEEKISCFKCIGK